MSSLQALVDIITNGVKRIELSCAEDGASYPTLNDMYSREAAAVQGKNPTDTTTVIAAAQQLVATLSTPSPYLFTVGLSVGPRARFSHCRPLTLQYTVFPECVARDGRRGLCSRYPTRGGVKRKSSYLIR